MVQCQIKTKVDGSEKKRNERAEYLQHAIVIGLLGVRFSVKFTPNIFIENGLSSYLTFFLLIVLVVE